MSAAEKLRRIARRLRGGGLPWLIAAATDRIAPARPAMRGEVTAATAGRSGLEIGGPSRLFGTRGALPIYSHAARVDNVNFSTQTAWEQGLTDGGAFLFNPHRAPGTQWLREAVALTGLADGSFDFVASSHCLEHVANPLRALREWQRVTRHGGHLILALPDPERTFDHRRPVTTLAHLRDDFSRHTSEADMTHASEVLARHDLTRDAGVGSEAEFRQRVQANADNRCLHHHVFDLSLMSSALVEAGWRVVAVEKARPMHLLALARKDAA